MKKIFCLGVLSLIVLTVGVYAEHEIQGEFGPKIITLTPPRTDSTFSVEDVILQRRSIRTFTSNAISMVQLGQLCWAMQGITDSESHFRATPSAGALYPLEVYILNAEGVFHYLPLKHALKQLKLEDLRMELSKAALDQNAVSHAPVVFIITAVFERTTVKYKERGVRYVHMEAGHAAQNLLLQAVALNLGAVPMGAFQDQAVKRILNLSNDQTPLYLIPVGFPG